MENEAEKIDLIDYLRIIIKKGKYIFSVFLFVLVGTAIFTFLSPKVYRAETIISIGKTDGDSAEVVEKIKNDVYGISVREKLGGAEDVYNKIKTERVKDTDLIKIEIESGSAKSAKASLEELNRVIIAEGEERIRAQKELIEGKIGAVKNNIILAQNDIETINNKFKPVDNGIKRLQNSITLLEDEKLILEEKERILVEAGPYDQLDGQLSGSLFLLLDVRAKVNEKNMEIEKAFSSVNNLQGERENLNLQMNSFKKRIEDLNLEIRNLEASLISLEPVGVVKDPNVIGRPVKPNWSFNMVVAAILGVFFGVFMAFVSNWWNKNKGRI
ncbi:MAG: Wzz/FepE/Etk N-terminal domain-containing protein [bacterium]